MNKKSLLSILILTVTGACGAFKADEPKKAGAPINTATIRMTLIPQGDISAGKTTIVLAKLNNLKDAHIITADDLEIAHTEKFHLLIVDPSLTDYQHLHPKPTTTPGTFEFNFTPKLAGGYRAWGDLKPSATGKQEYVSFDLGRPVGGNIDKKESLTSTAGGYSFALSFDTPPVAGSPSMGTITVKDKKGAPVAKLSPVMGAFAHIVGFYDDFRTIAHMHPMGKEPTDATDKGGPELMFHFEPSKSGFVKLFAQVVIDGKEIYAPFGVNVAAEAKKK